MTVSNQTNRTSAVSTGAEQTIPFLFPVNANSDITVTTRDDTTGDEVTLAETTSYTVVNNGESGGSITTVTPFPTADFEIHIVRDTPNTQLLDLEQGGAFNAENVEDAFDKNTKLGIENQDGLDRTLKFPTTDPVSSFADMPNSIDRANKNLTFDSTGKPTASVSEISGSVAHSTIGEQIAGAADVVAEREILQIDIANIKSFGASESGDNVTAINDAITYASTNGMAVFIPKGTWVTSTSPTLLADTVIRGEGYDSVIKCTQNIEWSVDGVDIRGVRFQGPGTQTNTYDLVLVTGTPVRTKIRDCWVHDSDDNGISFKLDSGNVVDSQTEISGNFVYDNENAGIVTYGANKHLVTRNRCYNNLESGIHIDGALSINDVFARNAIITNNICTFNAGHGIRLETVEQCIVSGNQCKNNAGEGIRLYLNSHSHSIVGNVIINNNIPFDNNSGSFRSEGGDDSAWGWAGIGFMQLAHKNMVTGNIICNEVTPWEQSTAYVIGDYVSVYDFVRKPTSTAFKGNTSTGTIYRCTGNHTSSSDQFITDIANWSKQSTQTIDDAETNWTAVAPNSSALDPVDFKEGSNSVKLTIDSSHTTGLVAYSNITDIDINGETCSFWVKINDYADSIVPQGTLTMTFFSDDAGTVAIATYDITKTQRTVWTSVNMFLGDTSGWPDVKSIGISTGTDVGAGVTVNFDFMRFPSRQHYGVYFKILDDAKHTGSNFVMCNDLQNNEIAPIFFSNNENRAFMNAGMNEVVTSTTATLTTSDYTEFDTTDNAIAATLPDGQYIGQQKTMVLTTDGGNDVTLTVTSHVTSDPEVFTFADAADTLVLQWNGSVWMTIHNSGVAV